MRLPMKNSLEIRNIGEIRLASKEEGSRHIEGYAVVFDSPSEDLGFIETISPGAIDEDTLSRSDVLFKFNHEDSKVLARWNKGEGSLKLSLDEVGLKYEFEAPHTDLGDEVLEFLRRGDISKSSFAFTLPNEDGCEKWEKRDGQYYRTINKIDRLWDCSCVWNPAYGDTSCSTRAKEIMRELDEKEINNSEDMDNKEKIEALEEEVKKLRELIDNSKDEESEVEEEPKEDEVKSCEGEDEKEEEKSEEEPKEEEPVDEKSEEEEIPAEEPADEKEEEKNNFKRKMEKKFSLVKAIRSIVNNEKMDDATLAVINAGKEELRAAGLGSNGQITIPGNEERAAITVTTEGDDVVVTDFKDILKPLYARSAFLQSGPQVFSNCTGDIQVPVMSKANVAWEGETDAADDAGVTFSHVKLQPHRLTAYIPVSTQMLAQDSLSVEANLRQNLVDALAAKIDYTVFSNNHGTGPDGLAYGATAYGVEDFEDVCELESKLDDANVFTENCKYVLSNKAKADLRGMIKGTNGTGMVLENGEVDGTPAVNTSNVSNSYLFYGNWADTAFAQWQGVDIIVDPYTQAKSGIVNIIASTFVDFKKLRDNSIVYAYTK